MGKISKLPEDEKLAIIGYLAQEGVIREITAEVPLRKTEEFQAEYHVKPYPINSDKKYGYQFRIYLTDPDSAPTVLRDALDMEHGRLNDTPFVKELVDDYGFSFFAKQDSRIILEKVKRLPSHAYDSFLNGFNTYSDFIQELRNKVQGEDVPSPEIGLISDVSETSGKKKKMAIVDSNALFSEEQLKYLGWAGEEYLFKFLRTGTDAAFSPFSIDVSKVKKVVWFNEGYSTADKWEDKSIGKGCDILVKTADTDYYIEVKSSRRRSPVFGMTSLEMQKMMELRCRYYLAKLDYMENLIAGHSPILRVFQDPYARFFTPTKMQKTVFFCD